MAGFSDLLSDFLSDPVVAAGVVVIAGAVITFLGVRLGDALGRRRIGATWRRRAYIHLRRLCTRRWRKRWLAPKPPPSLTQTLGRR